MSAPDISVIVPVWNADAFVGQALESIRGQERDDLEVLLVDDGSSDAFPARAGEFVSPFRYVRQPNSGPAAARNRGVDLARGRLIAFLDADDRWTAGHLNRLAAALRENSEAGIAQGRMQQFASAEAGYEYRSGPYRMPYLGSCLFRRWVFEECGGFDATMRYGEDYDFLFRCWERNILKCDVEEVSLLYRRHSGNASRANHALAHAIVLKRRIERIRAGKVDPHRSPAVLFQKYIGETPEAVQWNRLSV